MANSREEKEKQKERKRDRENLQSAFGSRWKNLSKEEQEAALDKLEEIFEVSGP